MKLTVQQFEKILRKSWSRETALNSNTWTKELPEKDQCAVTALVIDDYYGGEIVRCEATGSFGVDSHYFNIIGNQEIDFTRTQYPNGTTFSKAGPRLQGYPTTRDYLLSNSSTNSRYDILREKVSSELTRDRAIGAFIGLAVGDALGAPLEFKEPNEFTPITDYTTGGVWKLPLGYWTDDTSMAICLAKSILDTDKIDPYDLLPYFCRWYLQGENSSTGKCFDIGNTTRNALVDFIRNKKYTPAKDESHLSGNGSIMRLAPAAIRWYNYSYLDAVCREQSLTTHGSRECIDCCIELGHLISDGIKGNNVYKDLQAFSKGITKAPNSGRALDTLTAAKWAVGSTDNFDDAVLAAANLGGDSDTISCVTGQIAGSIYGLSGIRDSWIDRLYMKNELIDLADSLYQRTLN